MEAEGVIVHVGGEKDDCVLEGWVDEPVGVGLDRIQYL